MNYIPSDEALELGAIVRRFLDKHSPEDAVRDRMSDAGSYDPQVWRTLAVELGVHGLAVPEEFGGSGAGFTELGIVFQELGRNLYGAPILASVGFATTVLLHCTDTAARQELLPPLASGEMVAAVAWGGPDPSRSSATATAAGGESATLNGLADYVLSGPQADLLLVSVTTADGPAMYAVEDARRLPWQEITPLDQTRKLGHVELRDVPARRLAITGDALDRAVDIWTLLLAAEQLGGAAQVLEQAVEYARTRIQFGRPIGSFQAIKHRCADLLVAVELARSAVWHGLWTADHNPPDLAIAAALAGSVATDTYMRTAAENVQIHGGIGFTWEHPAHLYLKRAKTASLLLRSPAQNRDRMGTMLEIPRGVEYVGC
ncbi:MAG: acyl-CoA/acyl-ACP dehydrogenase [Actinomycetota bacterium]|nr:acyl-CoA/acyl-ACP dehydrogenase [Actinomycetota bacterium]